MTYGEKEHIGESEYLRIFSNDVLKKLKNKLQIEKIKIVYFD